MKKVELQPRDIELLHFLWRWKLVSAAALFERFYPGLSIVTPCIRLRRLEMAEYIRFQILERSGGLGAWSLDREGFRYLKETNRLPDLEEDGFRAEHCRHDFMVSAVHLGDWLLSPPQSAEVVSEQELRRLHVDDYPSWVPRAKSHRPDGYWRVPLATEGYTVALEVERNVKSPSEYEAALSFYNDEDRISRVLWIVPRLKFARTRSAVLTNHFRSEPIHNFVAVEDFEKHGWNAIIRSGSSENKTIAFLLSGGVHPRSICSYTYLLTDRRKNASRYDTSAPLVASANCK